MLSTGDSLIDANPAHPGTEKLRAVGIAKRYDSTTALEPTDITVHPGEFLTILGPSGSGKTTLLQIVSGLVPPTSGRIFIDGTDHTDTPVHRRDIGLVFQSYALFPHLTVGENIAFPLRMRRHAEADIKRRVDAALDMVQLAALADRLPTALSGGQQQRVALARCFVYQPAIILMDEPLGALDKKLREHMQIEIRRMHRDSGATIIYVTHDQDEALALSDRICLMNHARIAQIGTPRQIYQHPTSEFAADFIGLSNIFRGQVTPSGQLETPDGVFPLPTQTAPGTQASLILRPEELHISQTPDTGLPATVIETVYAGAETRLICKLPSGTEIIVRTSASTDLTLGTPITLLWPPTAGTVLPAMV